MSTKPFLLIASALAVVGGLWLTRSDQPTSQPPAVQSPFQSSSSASNLDEVDRLIGEFTTRYAEFGGVTNGTTLGRLYLIRGRITGRVDDYGAASAALASTLVEASQSTDTRLFLGYAVNGLHRFGEANMLANEILEAEPQRFDALALLGDTALSLGDYALARTSFSELDAALPGVPEVLIRQSQVAKIDGDAGRALAMASQAIESAEAAGRTDLDLAFYHAAHGALAMELGQVSIAVSSFNAALEIDPAFPAAVEGRGVARALQGDFENAIADLERMLVIAPDLHARLIFGDILSLAGEHERAASAYSTVASLAASDMTGVFNRQIATYHLDYDQALALALSELSWRVDAGAYDLAAWASFRVGAYEDARSFSDVALSLEAPSGLALYHAGAISTALGDVERAISELDSAFETNPYFDLLSVPWARELLDMLRSP